MNSNPFRCSWHTRPCLVSKSLNEEILKLLCKEKVTLKCIDDISQALKNLYSPELRCTTNAIKILTKIQIFLIKKKIIN